MYCYCKTSGSYRFSGPFNYKLRKPQTNKKNPNHIATMEMQPKYLRLNDVGSVTEKKKETLVVIEFSLNARVLCRGRVENRLI